MSESERQDISVPKSEPKPHTESEVVGLILHKDQLYSEDGDYVTERDSYVSAFRELLSKVADGRVSADEAAALLAAQAAQGKKEAELDPFLGEYGVLNKFQAENKVKEAMAIGERHNLPISVIMLDLDHFRAINETPEFQHAAGDAALIEAARYLKKQLRPTDSLIRYGGEEFLIVLVAADENAAFNKFTEVAQDMPVAVRESGVLTKMGITRDITMSAGVVQVQPGQNSKEVINQADKRAYVGKGVGRNIVIREDFIGPKLTK